MDPWSREWVDAEVWLPCAGLAQTVPSTIQRGMSQEQHQHIQTTLRLLLTSEVCASWGVKRPFESLLRSRFEACIALSRLKARDWQEASEIAHRFLRWSSQLSLKSTMCTKRGIRKVSINRVTEQDELVRWLWLCSEQYRWQILLGRVGRRYSRRIRRPAGLAKRNPEEVERGQVDVDRDPLGWKPGSLVVQCASAAACAGQNLSTTFERICR